MVDPIGDPMGDPIGEDQNTTNPNWVSSALADGHLRNTMTKELFAHLTQRLLQTLSEHRDFFSKGGGDRQAILEKAKMPKSFESYMLKVSEGEFMKDLGESLAAVDEEKTQVVMQNGLSDAFASYVSNEVGSLLDRIPLAFYSLSVADKRTFLQEKAKLPEIYVDLLSASSHQDMFESLFGFLKRYNSDTPYIVVQMARDCSKETKQEMRARFKEQYENTFPFFQVSKYLFGGMKVFIDGAVADESWLGKIERFTATI